MPSRSSVVRIARLIAGRPDQQEPMPADRLPERSIGVIFVHGMGNQPPLETLLRWANPIVEMLTAWRREYDETTNLEQPIGEDPVVNAAVEQGGDGRAWVRIGMPQTGDAHPATTWLLTEAYWTGQVRAPSFVQTVRYLLVHLRAVLRGTRASYALMEEARAERLARIIFDQPTPWDPQVASDIADLKRSASARWRWIAWLEKIVRTSGVTAASLLGVAVFALLRVIPIKAIRERAELSTLDTVLVSDFGDLAVLLDDPVHAAWVRQRLADAIHWTVDQGCEDVILIAHASGAIVTYTTLLDEVYRFLPVAKLITLGQSLALGWHLERTTGRWVAGNPIRGDLGAARPELRWVDFWASSDLTPAGPLFPVDGCPLVSLESTFPGGPASPIQIESRPLTNFMHASLDHDGYWANDEGFLIPLVRHLDDPRGDGSASRFYRSRLGRAVRIERRWRRVGLLLGWRWLSSAAAIVAVALAIIPSVTPGVSLAASGDGVAVVWSKIPANELVSGSIDQLGGAIALGLDAIGLHGMSAWLTLLGPYLLGALVPVGAAFAIYSRGVDSWRAADAAERQGIRREAFGPAGQAWARSEAILLSGGLIGLVIAASGPETAVLLGWFVVVALVAWVVRQS